VIVDVVVDGSPDNSDDLANDSFDFEFERGGIVSLAVVCDD